MAKHKRESFIREIHTGLYGPAAETALNNVIGYCRRYGSKLDANSFKMVETERSTDNEIMLSVFNDTWNVSRSKTVFKERYKNDEQVRVWLAGCVKGVAKIVLSREFADLHKAEIAKIDGWTRTNTANLRDNTFSDTEVPVAAYYAVYEILKGRKVAKNKFPPEIFDSTVGSPFDPVRTELETYKREATDKIHADLTAEIARLDKELQDEIGKLREKFDNLKGEAKTKAESAERTLNDEIAAALNAAA